MAGLFFLGVDGGGTHCRARLADSEGRALGEGTGGPANARLGSSLVMQSILTASGEAAIAKQLCTEAANRAADMAIQISSANLAYQAALQPTASIRQTSPMDYQQ